MSERKAINKYYPPDYDPAKVPKKKKNLNPNAEKVRLMVPFSMKCLQCSEYIASRRKFNARKEVTSEKYMGIKIIRFHIKCPRCNNSLVFQTDPKSAGFLPVSGCQRNYESLSTKNAPLPIETDEEILARLEREEIENQKYHEQQQRRKANPFWQHRPNDSAQDALANLEDKLLEQKREQDIHDHLESLKEKALRLQQAGGHAKLADQAHEKVRLQLKHDLDDDPPIVPNKRHQTSIPDQTTYLEKSPAPMTVPSTFVVKKPPKHPTDGVTISHPTSTSKSTLPVALATQNVMNGHCEEPATRSTSAFQEYESSSDDST